MAEISASTSTATSKIDAAFRNSRPGVVFLRTLRENLTGIIAWGTGYSTLIVLIAVLYPVLEGSNLLESIISGLGLMDRLTEMHGIDPRLLATFPIYLAIEGLELGPLILSAYCIPQALRAVSGEEERGTLDLLLSTPLPRWQLLTEKTLAIVASLVMILTMMWASLLGITAVVEGSDISLSQATQVIWHLLPVTLVVLTLTLMLSVLLRNPRTVGGLAALAVLGSFFMRGLANAANSPVLDVVRDFFLFDYYSSILVVANGVPVHTEIGLLVVACVFYVIALFAFNRRDIGV